MAGEWLRDAVIQRGALHFKRPAGEEGGARSGVGMRNWRRQGRPELPPIQLKERDDPLRG
jgi:hypothetical protein